MFDNPFRVPGQWFKANLHAHTTASDGDATPEESIALYKQNGYQVLALTDHSHVTVLDSPKDSILLLPGVEFGGGRTRQGTYYHVVGLNVRSRGQVNPPNSNSTQDIINFICDDGGLAFLAHPYWSGLMAEDVEPLKGLFALEVYNTGCDLEILRGFSMVHWDDLLSLGYQIGGLAVDDGHQLRKDHGRGWTMIHAAELSVEAIAESLETGHYYSSTGPTIEDLEINGNKLLVRTSPVKSISLVSTPEAGARCDSTGGDSLTVAEFNLPGSRYCRIEVIDNQGEIAWSNPIYLSC